MERIVIAMFLFTVRHRHPRQIHSIRTLIPSLYRNQFNITLQSDQQMVSSLQFHRLKTVRPCWIFPMSSTFPTHLKPADLMCTRKMRNYYVSVIWQQGGKRWTQKQKQTSKRHEKNASDVHFGGAWFQSCPGALATWLRICGFPPFLPVNVGGVPRFGNCRLLTNPLQFIIHRYVVCDTDSVMKQITHTELHFQKQTTQVNLKSGSMTQSLHRETLMSFLGTAPVQLSDFAPGNMKRQGWRKR